MLFLGGDSKCRKVPGPLFERREEEGAPPGEDDDCGGGGCMVSTPLYHRLCMLGALRVGS